MKSAEDVESYLLRMGVPYETVNPGLWLVKTDGPPLVISMAGPVVAFRLKLMDAAQDRARRAVPHPAVPEHD